MASTVEQQFRVRFGAASLHLRVCEPQRQAAMSAEQTRGLVELLKGGGRLTPWLHQQLTAIVVEPSAQGWVSSDRAALLECIDDLALKKRRTSQLWGMALLSIFTEDEWRRWKEADATTNYCNTLDEMISRVKLLGGKNLCEYSKKVLTAVWLHLRGDGRGIGMTGREAAQMYVKKQLLKATRDFHPTIYLEKLPALDKFAEEQPALLAAAYTTQKPPKQIPPEDCADIMVLDAAMQCRGGGTHMHVSPVNQNPHASQMLQMP